MYAASSLCLNTLTFLGQQQQKLLRRSWKTREQAGEEGFLGCWVMWMDCRVFSFTLLHFCHRRRKSSPLIRSWVLSTLNFYFEASLQLHIYKQCLPLLAQKQHCPAPPPLVPAFQKCHPWDSLVSTRSLAKKHPALAGSSGFLGISLPRHILYVIPPCSRVILEAGSMLCSRSLALH